MTTFEMKYHKKDGFSIHSDSKVTADVLDIAEATVETIGEFLLSFIKTVKESS